MQITLDGGADKFGLDLDDAEEDTPQTYGPFRF